MAISQNERLVSLKLGYNNLGDKGVEILAKGVAHHLSLESIDLGFNGIGDEGCCRLGEALSNSDCPLQLKTLYLAGNNIRESGAAAIGNVVKKDTLATA